LSSLWKGVSEIDYPAILEQAWQQHLEPKVSDAPTVISTFAGGGGSSLGYSMAGYRELLAVEWDNNAVETFKLNFPDVPVYHGDIAKLSVEECIELARLSGPGELDLLDGSPPCQGFSTAGKRILTDSRNQLFREYVRLLRGLKPKVFVMENVSGMVKGKMKLVFAEIMRELKASGYKVSARLMNAKYFYVPQSRERMIFIGVREDLGVEPGHPGAESGIITIREAWENVEIQSEPYLSPKLKGIISKIPIWGDGGDVCGQFFSTKRFAWNKPARTLLKGNIGSRACFVHPNGERAITEAEAKRCQSFPDLYTCLGGYKKSMEYIGNSVSPLFMRSIAQFIRYHILEYDTIN
jgi:DNA (cytosine-5)-methyltransferase 1